MSRSASIAANLPYPRRFARALTASQTSGDNYAVATLEAIAEDAETTGGQLEPLGRHYTRCSLKSGVLSRLISAERTGPGIR